MRSLTSLLLGLALLAACRTGTSQRDASLARGAQAATTNAELPGAVPPGSPAWRALADEYLAALFRADPHGAARLGRHEYDGGLREYTAEAFRQDAVRLRTFRDRALALDPRSLSPDDEYERALLLADVREGLFWLERVRAPQRNCMLTAGGLSPGLYALRAYAPADVRARALARHARALPRAIGQIRALLERPLPRPHAEVCAAVCEGLATFLENDARAAFADIRDRALQDELAAALASGAAAARDQARWFKEQLPGATGSFALGRALYEQMIRATEGLDLAVEALEAIGNRDLEANTAALKEACTRFAPGADLAACVDRMQARKPPGGTLVAARRELPELLEFVRSRSLATVASPEQPRVEESPSFARWNAASIDIPGPYDHGIPSIFHITPPDPAWPRAEQEAYLPSSGLLSLISIHEVWPGHYLQYTRAQATRWPLARVFTSYAFTEGWAHYAEQLMWDAGYGAGELEVRIAQLQEALLRDVRFLSSIGLHVRGMTVAESERLFRERAFQDAGNARQQAARGTFDPGYLNYTLGKLEILRLREEWTASRGGRAAWGKFHDALLGLGAPRLGIARARLLGQPLPEAVTRAR